MIVLLQTSVVQVLVQSLTRLQHVNESVWAQSKVRPSSMLSAEIRNTFSLCFTLLKVPFYRIAYHLHMAQDNLNVTVKRHQPYLHEIKSIYSAQSGRAEVVPETSQRRTQWQILHRLEECRQYWLFLCCSEPNERARLHKPPMPS